MSTFIGGAVKNQSTALAETVLYSQDFDWAGTIQYQVIVRGTSVGTLGLVFRWNDRNGTARNHTRNGLSLLALGPAVSDQFQLWTEYATASEISVEITLTGILGTPVFDFYCSGAGDSYGA